MAGAPQRPGAACGPARARAALAAWSRAVLALALPAASGAGTPAAAPLGPCPGETNEKSSWPAGEGAEERVEVEFVNESPLDVQLVWVSQTNQEQHVAYLATGAAHLEETFVGHLFNVRSAGGARLMTVHRVEAAAKGRRVPVRPCAELDGRDLGSDLDASRWDEFDRLARRSGSPCVGPSANWSCVREVSEAMVASRDPSEYGFLEGELRGSPYEAGATVDHLWMSQQSRIVNVTRYDEGFLKMEITDGMRSLLYPWYAERLQAAVRRKEEIPGFFTNSRAVPVDNIDLQRDLNVRYGVAKEVRQVLQWWTKMPLRHSTTFGVRIYRRGSVVINHLDRSDTHIASAVIHVGSRADEGWPLEIIHPHRPGRTEVYLQPGEMLLYEGARIVHGRPMRFKGSEFANILSHFKPVTWKGPTSWENPFFRAPGAAHRSAPPREEL